MAKNFETISKGLYKYFYSATLRFSFWKIKKIGLGKILRYFAKIYNNFPKICEISGYVWEIFENTVNFLENFLEN